MQLSVPAEKRAIIKQELLSCSNKPTISLRTLSRVLGRLNALTTIIRSLRYHCNPLAIALSNFTLTDNNWDSQIEISADLRQDLP